jgi:transketolase
MNDRMHSTHAVAETLDVGDFTARGNVYGGGPARYYGEALLAAARANPDIVALGADLSASTETDLIRDALPGQFYMIGMMEANLMGVAAGMAKSGLVPFTHTFSVFCTRRPFDQVAMQIAYPRANVKIVGFLPGITTLLGVSHQAIEDIALMRALPNMTIVEPMDATQIAAAVDAAAAFDGPVYLRMRRADAPLDPATPPMPLEIGRAQVLREGRDGVIFACGLMVAEALAAAERLRAEGAEVSVVNVHTIKPLDTDTVLGSVCAGKPVITAENHTIIGGLGSAIAETLMEAGVSAPFARIGLRDTFAEGGSTPYLQKRYGLHADDIVAAYRAKLEAKRERS